MLGTKIDLWVGDFDSSDGLILDAPRERHPAAKDSTDFELAVRVARQRGASELVILGAFGGRFDHAFALALGACRLAAENLKVTLHSGDEAGYPLLPGVPVELGLAGRADLQRAGRFQIERADPARRALAAD